MGNDDTPLSLEPAGNLASSPAMRSLGYSSPMDNRNTVRSAPGNGAIQFKYPRREGYDNVKRQASGGVVSPVLDSVKTSIVSPDKKILSILGILLALAVLAFLVYKFWYTKTDSRPMYYY